MKRFAGIKDLDKREEMVAPGRFELPTSGLGNRCSIHLSYGATLQNMLIIDILAALCK